MNSIVERIFHHPGEKPALIVNDRTVTYAELRTLVQRYAQVLRDKGIKKGDRVVIKGIADLDFVVGVFAIHLCGGVSVPVEKSAPIPAIEGVFRELDAKLALVDFETDAENFCTFSDIRTAMDTITPGKFSFPGPEDTGDIMYTTGTTGKSKGIELSHRNIEAAVENIIHFVEMKPDNVNLIPVPINHAFGIRRMYANFYTGATVVLMNGITSLKKFYHAIEAYQVTSLTMVATSFEFIFRMSGEKLGDYKEQFRYMDIGAQAVPNELQCKLSGMLPDVRLYNIYGSSEAGCVTGMNFNSTQGKTGSIGVDAVNANIVFMDENKQIIDAVDSNTAGFLAVSGDVVMQGYVNDPQLTAETLRNGYVVTNDIGYRDSDGYIFLLGRKGDVINIGGHKVAPSEVEEVAMRYPEVEDCACVPFEDPKGIVKEVPKLFVVPKDECELSTTELRSFLSKQLELYKVPVYYEIIDSIPRTYNGKIQRYKLKKSGGMEV